MYMLWHLISTLLVGIAAGFIANKLMGNDATSISGNLCLGLVGSIVGSLLAGLLGLGSRNMLGSLILAVIGACIAVWVYNKIKS
jgi:uncharacterized membrane protein YeaQ/YmgE (transglycosylase-associated protein family)